MIDRHLASDYLRLGSTYRALDRRDESIAAFEAALRHYPRFAPPHNGLGAIYAEMGDYERAIHHFESALSIGNLPHDVLARIYNGLGNVYYLVGRHSASAAAYQQAMRAQLPLRPSLQWPRQCLPRPRAASGGAPRL